MMSELGNRVVARLKAVEDVQDRTLLFEDQAVADALALLCEITPAPEAMIDLGAVQAILWTFWLRVEEAPTGPAAKRDSTIVEATLGFLGTRIGSESLPGPLRDVIDIAEPRNGTRFAYVVGACHGGFALETPDLSEDDRVAALDRALAWSKAAARHGHGTEAVIDAALQQMTLWSRRADLAADPGSLATAGWLALGLFGQLRPDNAAHAAVIPQALETIVRASTLLGEPTLDRIEPFVRSAPPDVLTPDAAEALAWVRDLHARPVDRVGGLDAEAGTALFVQSLKGHSALGLACSIRRLRAALAKTSRNHSARPGIEHTLGQALAALGRERGDDEAAREGAGILAEFAALAQPVLEEAIHAGMRKFVALLESEDLGRTAEIGPLIDDLLANAQAHADCSGLSLPSEVKLSVVLLDIFATIISGSTAIADRQFDRFRAALAELPADKPNRHAYVAVLAGMTGVRATALREADPSASTSLLAEARSLTDEVTAAAGAGFPPLGLLRRERFVEALNVALHSIPAADLEECAGSPLIRKIAEFAGLVSAASDDPGHSLNPKVLAALLAAPGAAPGSEESSTLDAEAAPLRTLLDEIPAHRPAATAKVARSLAELGVHHDDPAVVEEAIGVLRDVRSRTPHLPESITRALAEALTAKSQVRFDLDALDEATALLAGLAPEDSLTLVAFSAAIEEFFTAMQHYVFNHDVNQREHARNLAARLGKLVGRFSPLDRRLVPAPEVFAAALADLAETVGPGGWNPNLTDVQVDRCRQTFAACPADHPYRPLVLGTLTTVLLQRARTIRGTDPGRATALMTEADQLTREGEPDQPAFLRAVVDLIKNDQPPDLVSGRPALPPATTARKAIESALLAPRPDVTDVTAAIARLRDPLLPALSRALLGFSFAFGALRLHRRDLALRYAEEAVELVALTTDRGSDQLSAEHGLTTLDGQIRRLAELILLQAFEPGEAAASALRVIVTAIGEGREPPPPESHVASIAAGPDVGRVAAVLERGRGVLLARQLDTRTDLEELRSVHPSLAGNYERLANQLTAEPDALARLRLQDDPPAAGRAAWSRLAKLRASRELDELIDRVRAKPGFSTFLRPLSAEQLRALAGGGPIVVLNHGQDFCHAIIVTTEAITSLRLVAKSAEVTAAAQRLRDALEAINSRGRERPPLARLVEAGTVMRETLSWIWHQVVRPILRLADIDEPVPAGAPWPRVWWVPTGPFTALPLHAAECALPGCEFDGCGGALDFVVSSYVPGFRTLAHARVRARYRSTVGGHDALVVASSEDDLPGPAAAARLAADWLGAPAPLIGAAATREAVLLSLAEATWAHFGCHATSERAEPSSGVLHLPSGEQLTVLDIARVRLRTAKLAFLSACGTARTSERLADEAIHITSAFLIAGFPEAIGTLWEVDSTHAAHLTRAFYLRATAKGADPAVYALHHTIRELKLQFPAHPHIWAAYLHAGA